MSTPIVFISNQKIKEGRLEEYKQYYREVAAMTEATKPFTAGHLAYLSEDGANASIIHVFADAQAMEMHMKGVDELARVAYQFMDIVSFEIYGDPGDALLETMMKITSTGVAVHLKPHQIGGYIRLKPG